MTLRLVKKDFLLSKWQILFTMGLSIILPLLLAANVPIVTGTVAFIYSVAFTVLICMQSVSMVEAKHPKAVALICAAPYSRNSFVKAKYACILLLFAYCYAAYSLAGFVLPAFEAINLSLALAVLMCVTIIYSVYLPMYFKLGFEKTKFIFFVAIFLIAYVTPLLLNLFESISFDFLSLILLPASLLNIAMLTVSIVVLYVSMNLSMKIFSKKEL